MSIMRTVRSAALLLALSSAVSAHHSGAMFDMTKLQTITGFVTEFNWTNPHSSCKLKIIDASGVEEIWAVEMGSPNSLIHEGWRRSSLKVGDRVSAVIHSLRDGLPGGSFVSVTLPMGPCSGRINRESRARPRIPEPRGQRDR